MITGSNIWLLLAGLAIFLFGMGIFEESIKNLATKNFKALLEKYAGGKIKSVFAGIGVTAILQSSTATSLIILALVGSGMMNLPNAIGAVLGASVGTTFTETAIGLVGLKFSLTLLSYPLIALGGLMKFFLRSNQKIQFFSSFMIGFGFLFLGLDYMKQSVDVITQSFDLQQFIHLRPRFYFLIGLAMSALVHSSSATAIIVLTALYGGVITLPFGIAALLGAYIGTTVTAVLGSIGENVIKKQVAFGYVLFTCLWSSVGFFFFDQILFLFNEVLNLEHDPVTAASIFHIFFKFVGVVCILPVLNLYTAFIEYIIPNKKEDFFLHIDEVGPDVIDLGMKALKKDIDGLIRDALVYHAHILNLDETEIIDGTLSSETIIKTTKFFRPEILAKNYLHMKKKEEKMLNFVMLLRSADLSPQELTELQRLNFSIVNIVYTCKYIKDSTQPIAEMRETTIPFVQSFYQQFRLHAVKIYKRIFKLLEGEDAEVIFHDIFHLFREIKHHDQVFFNSMTYEMSQNVLSEFTITSLLNTSRFMTSSMKSLMLAIKEFYMKEKK